MEPEAEGAAIRGRSSPGNSPSSIPTLGRYQVHQKVGCGGFGSVYRGFDPLLAREVALKTCEVAGAEVRARFAREARLAASLRHPAVTTVHDFGFEGTVPFLVYEYLEGADLDEAVASDPSIPVLEKVDILIAVAEALECAHAGGVLHRDVKPGNVRLLPDGSVKLMDFGIAKLLETEERMTVTGALVGSPAHMAPERPGNHDQAQQRRRGDRDAGCIGAVQHARDQQQAEHHA